MLKFAFNVAITLLGLALAISGLLSASPASIAIGAIAGLALAHLGRQ